MLQVVFYNVYLESSGGYWFGEEYGTKHEAINNRMNVAPSKRMSRLRLVCIGTVRMVKDCTND